MGKEKEVVCGSKLSWAVGATASHHRLSLMVLSGQSSGSGLQVSSHRHHGTTPLILLKVTTEQARSGVPVLPLPKVPAHTSLLCHVHGNSVEVGAPFPLERHLWFHKQQPVPLISCRHSENKLLPPRSNGSVVDSK